MPKLFFWCLLLVCMVNKPALAQDAAPQDPFAEAERFVHTHLYTGMLHVWEEDKGAWNRLLNVHACGAEGHKAKLHSSYQAGHPLFSQAMLNLAEQQVDYQVNAPVLSDVAQLAYRLFSASYAHGYARRLTFIDKLAPGLLGNLCGQTDIRQPQDVAYPQIKNWQTSDGKTFSSSQHFLDQHAQYGFQVFSELLNDQYDSFDALVFSHAYQHLDAYQTLFFEVNRYQNVQAYQKGIAVPGNELTSFDALTDSESGHADFAYLVLSSGYHWGTMSVLAMLEEEFPEVHDEVKEDAVKMITDKLAALQPQIN